MLADTTGGGATSAFVLTFWVGRKIDRAIAGFREYALVWCQVEVCDLVPALVPAGSDRAILRSDGYNTDFVPLRLMCLRPRV